MTMNRGTDGVQWTITAPTSGSTTYNLRATDKKAQVWYVHYVPGAGSPASFVPKVAAPGQGLSGANLIACVYYDVQGNLIAAGASSNSAMIYQIVADGAEVSLEFTGAANGGTAYCWTSLGS